MTYDSSLNGVFILIINPLMSLNMESIDYSVVVYYKKAREMLLLVNDYKTTVNFLIRVDE